MQAGVLTRGRVPVAVIACLYTDALSVGLVVFVVLLALSVADELLPALS